MHTKILKKANNCFSKYLSKEDKIKLLKDLQEVSGLSNKNKELFENLIVYLENGKNE